jgi:predicted Zn-dependent protease
VAPAAPAAAPAVAPQAAAPAAAPTKAAAPAATDDDSEEGAPEALLRAGRQALSADDAPGAERIARQALGQFPQDHHAMELMVLALMDQDRGTEALPYARRMVQKRSRRVPYRLLLGDLLLMVGDDGAARAEWQKALALSPGDRAIKRRLGL